MGTVNNIFLGIILALLTGCSEKSSSQEVIPQDVNVKARVLYKSCAGTILQFIDPLPTVGQDWTWYRNLNGPFDNSNPSQVYTRCVSAFGLSDNLNVGDTLGVTYNQIPNPPGDVCAIGGMPTLFISVKQSK